MEWQPLGYLRPEQKGETEFLEINTIGQMAFIFPSRFSRPHYYSGPAFMALGKLIDHVLGGSPRSEKGEASISP